MEHTLEHVATDCIAIGMHAKTKIAVESINQVFKFRQSSVGYTGFFNNGTKAVRLTDAVNHAAQGSVGGVSSPRLDDRADKLHTLLRFLKIHFVGMDQEMQVLLCPHRQFTV